MYRRMSPLRVIGFVRVVVADHCPRKTRLQRCRKQGKVLRRWWLSDHADATDPRGASFLAQKQLLSGAGARKLLLVSGYGCGCSLPCDFRYTKWRQKGRERTAVRRCQQLPPRCDMRDQNDLKRKPPCLEPGNPHSALPPRYRY